MPFRSRKVFDSLKGTGLSVIMRKILLLLVFTSALWPAKKDVHTAVAGTASMNLDSFAGVYPYMLNAHGLSVNILSNYLNAEFQFSYYNAETTENKLAVQLVAYEPVMGFSWDMYQYRFVHFVAGANYYLHIADKLFTGPDTFSGVSRTLNYASSIRRSGFRIEGGAEIRFRHIYFSLLVGNLDIGLPYTEEVSLKNPVSTDPGNTPPDVEHALILDYYLRFKLGAYF